MNSTMTVLKIMPGRKPEKITIPHTLDAMQYLVCGSIQAIYPYEDNVALVCNEEGKLLGLEGNRRLGTDIITGVFYVVGENGRGNLISLTGKQMEKYRRRFWDPEYFTPAEISRLLFAFFNAGW